MAKIHIKLLSEESLSYLKKNVDFVVEKLKTESSNSWIGAFFPIPIYLEKTYEIDDFNLKDNPNCKDKQVDFENSVCLYEHLRFLPQYILTDVRFWLWLQLEKFYPIVIKMIPIKDGRTLENMWLQKPGIRRGLMFGVLSRCFFRVALSVDENAEDKYYLTRWVIDNPERFRNLTWRSFSSETHLVRGILKGEKKAVDQKPYLERNALYPRIAKYVSEIGSVMLLDVISEEDIEKMVYNKMLELMN